ncbi:hypothetical protein L9F63_020645, partial [Diploptera punctata]
IVSQKQQRRNLWHTCYHEECVTHPLQYLRGGICGTPAPKFKGRNLWHTRYELQNLRGGICGTLVTY